MYKMTAVLSNSSKALSVTVRKKCTYLLDNVECKLLMGQAMRSAAGIFVVVGGYVEVYPP